MSTRKILVRAALALAIVGTVSAAKSADLKADGARVRQGGSLDLGSVSGVAYYTKEDSGYRVVVTLAVNKSPNAIRMEAVLVDEETVTLSTPGTPETGERTIEITRKGDKLIVTTASV